MTSKVRPNFSFCTKSVDWSTSAYIRFQLEAAKPFLVNFRFRRLQCQISTDTENELHHIWPGHILNVDAAAEQMYAYLITPSPSILMTAELQVT